MTDKPKIYVESSTISYLTARPSQDVIIAAKQELTRRWWKKRDNYDLFISETVLEEIGEGNKKAAELRIDAVKGITLIAPTHTADILADTLLASKAFPPNAEVDAYHVALATVHEMNVLLTWNQRHIASQSKRFQIESIIFGFGFVAPRLLTPEQLLLEVE